MDEEGKQLVAAGDMDNNVEFGSGGSELIITRRSDEGKSTKTLGSREYMRYYRQKPRPSPLNNMAITAALASRFAFKPHMSALLSMGKPQTLLLFGNITNKRMKSCNDEETVFHFRYRSMGLATVQSREQMVRMKVMKQMNRSGVEAMRSKIGMKSNVIRNLPNNVTY